MRRDGEQSEAELRTVLAVRQRWLVVPQDVYHAERLVLYEGHAIAPRYRRVVIGEPAPHMHHTQCIQ